MQVGAYGVDEAVESAGRYIGFNVLVWTCIELADFDCAN
jgi:hypothetical protein